MGGKKKQTIGYRIYLGMHAVFTHGPVDKVTRIQFDKKDAWVGELTSSGQISVNNRKLFGGEDIGGQGGVSGIIDFENGNESQGANSYLQAQIDSRMPAFRGVTAFVFRKFYFGMSQYLKIFNARLQRIHTTTGGATQWYDEKAAISTIGTGTPVINRIDDWEYQITPAEANPGRENFVPPSTGWQQGQSPFGHHDPGDPSPGAGPLNTDWPIGTVLWLRKVIPNKMGGILRLSGVMDNGYAVIINGQVYAQVNPDNLDPPPSPTDVSFAGPLPNQSTIEIVVKAYDEADPANNTYFEATGVFMQASDMNPAHIIRECLTDADWGMGYLAADVDDASFKTAADALYTEGMGMSILWDKSTKIEDFVKDVCRHINATLYVSRTTGKFVLKLIRNDYVLDDLFELHPNHVEKIENYTCQTDEELVNSVTVQFWDSSTNAQGSVTERDTALIQQQGAEINTTAQYPGFTNSDIGTRVALRDLVTLSTPLISCTVTADRSAKDLNIGDAFKLFWPDFNESYIVMRVVGMTLGNGKKNNVVLTVTQDQFALPGQGTSIAPNPTWEDPSGPPVAASVRIAVEAPYYELIQREDQSTVDQRLNDEPLAGYVLASAEKPNASSINMDLQVDSGAGYASEGTADFSPCAVLAADLPQEIGPSTVAVTPGSDFSRMTTGVHAQVGNELVRVDAVDTNANTVTLGRGVLDTVPVKHLTGSVLMSWDEYAAMDETQYLDGESIAVKLVTKSGSRSMIEASTPADTVVMDQRAIRPYAPGQVRLNGSAYPASIAGALTVTWKHRNRVTQADQLVDNSMGDVTPAPNNRYGLRFLDSSSTLLVERQDIGPGTASVVLNYTGDVTMELYAISNDAVSWQKHVLTFAYTPPSGTTASVITATPYTPVDDSTIIDGGGDD